MASPTCMCVMCAVCFSCVCVTQGGQAEPSFLWRSPKLWVRVGARWGLARMALAGKKAECGWCSEVVGAASAVVRFAWLSLAPDRFFYMDRFVVTTAGSSVYLHSYELDSLAEGSDDIKRYA
jgi:hypothetical protein